MAKWLIKAIIQKGFSLLPFGARLNVAAQLILSGGHRLNDAYFFSRLTHAANHLNFYKKYSPEHLPATCLEIGTGWHPVVPLAIYLSGGQQVYSCDNQPHLSLAGLAETVEKFRVQLLNGHLDHLKFLPDRINTLINWDVKQYNNLTAALAPFQLKYSSKGLIGLELVDVPMDMVFSNNTLGNVKEEELSELLLNCRNLLKADGIMSHFIDLTDQFSHFDSSIGPFNYLKYSKRQWRWLSNDLINQNRLRLKNYLELYQALDMPVLEQLMQHETEAAVFKQRLHTDYSQYSTEELQVSHVHLVSGLATTSSYKTSY